MRAVLQALQQTALAYMRAPESPCRAHHLATRLRAPFSNPAFPSNFRFSAAASTPPSTVPPPPLRGAPPRGAPLAMAAAGPWASFRRAVVSTVTSKKFIVAVGAGAAVSTVWASQGHWRSHTNPLHQQQRSSMGSASDIPDRRVQTSFSIGGEGATAVRSETTTLMLFAGHCMIPHPDKEDRGGEDAFFVCERSSCLGVADGVGGWAEVGVDPGLYSRELMERAKAFASTAPVHPDAPQAALEAAHAATTSRGSSTACILCLHGGQLHASNLGDSGFMVVRGGEVAFMSPQQQHDFNFPYQIGSVDSMGDAPQAAQRFVVDVQPGDVIVMATDGVFDNIYPDEAAALVFASKRKGDTPSSAAVAVAQFARMRAADPTHLSPFAYGAQQLGYRYFGGKMDDITVVCAYVESSESESSSSFDEGGAAAAAEKETTKNAGRAVQSDAQAAAPDPRSRL